MDNKAMGNLTASMDNLTVTGNHHNLIKGNLINKDNMGSNLSTGNRIRNSLRHKHNQLSHSPLKRKLSLRLKK